MSCAAGLLAATFHAAPTVPADSARALFVYTDAAKEGATVACLGGWLHGFFFSFPIPADLLGYPIPQLEFLAVIAAKLTFRRLVGSAPMMLLTDSETSFHVLDHDGARHEHMQYLHLVYLLDGGAFDGAAHTNRRRNRRWTETTRPPLSPPSPHPVIPCAASNMWLAWWL